MYLDEYICFFDQSAPLLSERHIPYHPTIVVANAMKELPYVFGSYEMERTFRRTALLYPLYVIAGAKHYCLSGKSGWNWAEIDLRLNAWSLSDDDGTALGKAFLVLGAKIQLYTWSVYPQYLFGERGEDKSHNVDIYFRYDAGGRRIFEDIVESMCRYLGVTHRPTGKPEKEYGTNKTIYFPADTIAAEALYSLAYALWYDCDGARARWGVKPEHIARYDGLTSVSYPARALYDSLVEAYSSYAAILRLNEYFKRQYG